MTMEHRLGAQPPHRAMAREATATPQLATLRNHQCECLCIPDPTTARACELPLRGRPAIRALSPLLPRSMIQLVFRHAAASGRFVPHLLLGIGFPPSALLLMLP